MDNKKLKLTITLILTVIVIGGGYYFYNNFENDIEPNQSGDTNTIPAIDFNVQNKDGINTYLSDFKDGKPIIINFWSSFCNPCVEEMPEFQKLYDDYKDKVHFIMIDSIGALGETKATGKAFIQKNNYTFPVYFDVNQNAQEAYGVYSFPTTYLINENFEIEKGGSGMINYEILSAAINEVLGD